jgi:hypothetical protein
MFLFQPLPRCGCILQPLAASGYQDMSLAQGPFGGTPINSITYTTASGTSIQFTDVNHANALAWMSEPFASGVTLGGTETCNIWAKEASAANNASLECQLVGVCTASPNFFQRLICNSGSRGFLRRPSSFIFLLLPPLGATKYSSPSVLDETTVRIHHIMEILVA